MGVDLFDAQSNGPIGISILMHKQLYSYQAISRSLKLQPCSPFCADPGQTLDAGSTKLDSAQLNAESSCRAALELLLSSNKHHNLLQALSPLVLCTWAGPHKLHHVLPLQPHLQLGVLVQNLDLPPQAGAANLASRGQLSQSVGRGADEGITHVLTFQVAGQDHPLGQIGGHILQEGRQLSQRDSLG